MLRIKVNTSSGKYVSKLDLIYIRPGKEGNECRNRCPQSPYYRCTRDVGHKGDCAAHGFVISDWSSFCALLFHDVGLLRERQLVMFARWKETAK